MIISQRQPYFSISRGEMSLHLFPPLHCMFPNFVATYFRFLDKTDS